MRASSSCRAWDKDVVDVVVGAAATGADGAGAGSVCAGANALTGAVGPLTTALGARNGSSFSTPFCRIVNWSCGLSYFTTIESQMRHITRLFGELRRRGADTFEVSQAANDAFLKRVTAKLDDSVFVLGNCASSRSYYFDPHGEASILRPTSTVNAFREAGRFPLDDYAYA